MLARIRKALGRPAAGAPVTSWEQSNLPDLGEVMPPIASEDLVPTFESELRKVAGNPHRAADPHELAAILREILSGSQGEAVVLSRSPLLTQLGLREMLQALGKKVSAWPPVGEAPAGDESQWYRERAFSAAVGITGVDFILAESGTLVLSSITEGAQLASLAPPIHVALYRRSQVLGSLEEVLERLPVPRETTEAATGRAVVFITGPSRTADIEQILIRGVHGPRDVHAILVEESCLA